MKYSITRPTFTDFEELRHLFSLTIRDAFRREDIEKTFADDLRHEIEFQIKTLQRCFASDGKEEYYLIARGQSRILGTAAFGITTGGVMSALGLSEPTIPELKSVYVLPEYQRMGIGSALVDRCLSMLSERGEPEFALECGYKTAQSIWKHRFGDPTVVVRDKFDKDAHLMFWRCRVTDHIP